MSLEKFAADTAVPVERSQAEARSILNAHGCTKFALADEGDRSAIQAVLVKDGSAVSLRFVIAFPAPDDKSVTHFKNRYGYLTKRSEGARATTYAQECRRRWRCLVLLLKAKFAAVDSGIVLFQDEFLAHLVLPSGETVATWAGREIAPAIAGGRMPTSLMLGTGG